MFTINGNPWWNLILITNVACAGDVQSASIMGSNMTGWQAMTQNWGQNWQSTSYLIGQSLSIQVTTSDGSTVTSYNVAPSNWTFGQTFEGGQYSCSTGGWCDPPGQNFDMAVPAFRQIANLTVGDPTLPLKEMVSTDLVVLFCYLFDRVPCMKIGGIMFTIKGNPRWNLILITNVACAGDVQSASIMGSNMTWWQAMTQNWGQNWQSTNYLTGQSLSIQVTTSDGRTVTSYNVAPSNWTFGQTFEGG
ncbi:hypothetical protein C3L33_02974, partial [Rhododendron williamsianum]